jgi:hypothetical protein
MVDKVSRREVAKVLMYKSYPFAYKCYVTYPLICISDGKQYLKLILLIPKYKL